MSSAWESKDMGDEVYTIKAGDTLSAIAQRHFGRASLWPVIFAHNAFSRHGHPPVLTNPDRLRIGQRIQLPASHWHKPPYLPYHLNERHPAQRTRPVIAPTTRPAMRRPSCRPRMRLRARARGEPMLIRLVFSTISTCCRRSRAMTGYSTSRQSIPARSIFGSTSRLIL
jgi:LysM repeat protein